MVGTAATTTAAVSAWRGFATAAEAAEVGGGEDGDDDNDGGNIVRRKKKLDANFYGIAHVQATFNNTIVNITDLKGDTIAWSSGGAAEGYR